MTDRELLELAAKAAGIELWKDVAGNFYTDPKSSVIWNPLTDDGDALRLAVMLGIQVIPYPIYEQPKHSILAKQANLTHSRFEVLEIYNDDPYAATRRAIVGVATKMEKEKQNATD